MRSARHLAGMAVLCIAMLACARTPGMAADGTSLSPEGLTIIEVALLVSGGAAVLIGLVTHTRRSAARRADELRAANARQRAIIDAVPDALFRMDADGRFLEFKPSSEFDPTVRPEEFLGKTVRDLPLPASMVIHWEGALQAASRDGGYHAFEYQLDHVDGPHTFEARIVRACTDEYLAIVRDISARKQTEADGAAYREQLERTVTKRTGDLIEANMRLQEANRAKSAFLTGMSHELRTPLNSIIGFADILLKGLAGELNEEQERQLTMIEDAGKQLLDLVDDVLDYTRIEAGRLTPLPTDIRIATLLGECVVQTRTDAELKGLELHVDVGRSPARIHSDRRLIEQVVLCLLSNAVKFTEEGSVTLRAFTADDEHMIIEVIDTGIGIPPQLMGEIFHAFEQGLSAMAIKPHGFGLGLPIAHQLTHLLGGSIDIRSRVDEGTTARVTLPIHLDVTPVR